MLGACGDNPVAPRSHTPHPPTYFVSAVSCTYTRGDSTIPCAQYASSQSRTLAGALAAVRRTAPEPVFAAAGARAPGHRGGTVVSRSVLLGEQGVNVRYIISNLQFVSPPLFTFDAAVQNLTTQPLGTADGRAPAPDSIEVFFAQTPLATQGTGTITTNAPDTGSFTATNQPFYRYPGLLPSNATTPTVNWQFNVPSGVQAFHFAVYITGQMPDTSAAALAIPAHAFDSLAIGLAHSCAVRPGNHEYCWGFNAYGALGIQATPPSPTPVGVLGNLAVQSVSAGNEFSCATAQTGAFCWGDNASGELGDGTVTDRGEPVQVTPPVGAFSQIVTGAEFSCGLAASTAYCWGDNYTGQLGNGGTTSHATPTAVAGSIPFVTLTAGAFHACGLTAGGAVYCWGANADGELGTGNTTSHSTPTQVNSSTIFASVAAGTNFTCALDVNGKAYCWGANTYGALGNGAVGGAVSSPTAVTGSPALTKLAAGGYHVCGITAAGGAYCWGSNSSGQLGINSTQDQSSPTAIPSFAFTAIAAGFAHTCALTSNGSTYCWGDNSSGQLGDGTLTQRLTPTAVALP